MGRSWAVLAVVLGSWSIAPPRAVADDSLALADHLWPSVPADRSLSLEDVITDHLSELGNMLGDHLDLLSDHLFGLHVDGRAQRAQLRLGGGNSRFLAFKLDSDWHFDGDTARIHARVDLGFHGHSMHLELPEMVMSTTSYHGESGVELRLPLFERRW